MREHTEEEQKKARERAEQTAARIITMSLGRSTERAWSAWTMYMADVHKHADNAKRSVCPPPSASVARLLRRLLLLRRAQVPRAGADQTNQVRVPPRRPASTARHRLRRASPWCARRVVFRAMREDAANEKRMRRVLQRVKARWTHTTTFKTFATWASNVYEIKHQRVVLERFHKRWSNLAASRAYDTWAAMVADRLKVKALIRRAIVRMQHARVARGFDAWCSGVSEACAREDAVRQADRQQKRDGVMMVIARWRGNTLYRTFAAWREYHRRSRWKQQMLLRFKIKWHKSGLARYFCAWQVFVGTIADTRRLVCLIMVRRWRGALHDALSAWRAQFGGSAAVLAGTLSEWQTRCAALQAELDAQRLARRSQIDRYIASVIDKTLRGVWKAWSDEVVGQRRLLSQCDGLKKRVTMMSVRKCLTAWVKDIAATREKRAHVKGMLKRVLNGKLTAAWKQLKGYMNELKQIEELEALEKAQREEKSMMQQARQAKTLQAIAIMRHSCQVKVLTGWHEYIVSKKHHKKMIDNLRNAIQKKISRQSFGMWQEYLSLRYQLRSGLQRILQRRARLMRQGFIRRWAGGRACRSCGAPINL